MKFTLDISRAIEESQKRPVEETLKGQDEYDEAPLTFGREKVGEAWDLIELGDVATIDYLSKELSVTERLDSMIDRALKRLLFVRGIKSYSQTPSEARIPASIKGPDAT